MISGKKVLAIIPARAGSKRVKHKNIRDFAGKPLVAWTIEAGKASRYIDHIYVSTDSEKIQAIANEWKVDADPLREERLSGDHATSVDVVLDVINHKKTDSDIIVLLQPTSPLRRVDDIDGALELFIEKKAKSVVSMCETETPLSWCTELDESLSLDHLVGSLEEKRSQDVRKSYQLNGAIYVTSVNDMKLNKTFYYNSGSIAYIIERMNSIDIDTEEDFELALSWLARKGLINR